MRVSAGLTKAARFSALFGVDPGKTAGSLASLPQFLADMCRYQRMGPEANFRLRLRNLVPMLLDRKRDAGTVSQYLIQDLWAARKVFERRPARHLDVGSRLDGFVSQLLVFMPVTVVDIRPLTSTIPGLQFLQTDATGLRELEDNSIDSLSSLNAAEHFGLGRYGDPVDPAACFKFMRALVRVLCPGGYLYFSVPVGKERLHFNAHRVFAPATILKVFGDLDLVSIACIDDANVVHACAKPDAFANLGHGCGLFEFKKPLTTSDAH